ncbi:MAG: endonuclease [Thermoleophilaceae bacterium]|jgi:endonuclease-8|nr:endonuclease [Thermoleophilaceae bacterium]
MPEGDTIHRAARRVGAALVGSEIRSIEMPQPRHSKDRWDERLKGRDVRSVDAHGKHLFVRFDGDLTLHSHLRMGGSWGVYPRGGKWHRGAHRAWLVIKTDEHDVVQFDGPVLELLTEGRTRFDRRLAALGPDVLAPEFDATQVLSRLRAQEPGRQIGDALLDQRVVSGIGTVWKSEGCFLAGISPWRRVQDVSDDEVLTVIREIRPLMALSVEGNGRRRRWVFERAGLPCRRCATPIRFRGQGDDNRNTFWCPECQR